MCRPTRIGVARVMLDQHRGTPLHQDIWKVQSMALVDLLKDKLVPEQSALIMERVLECHWWPQHKDDILRNLVGNTQLRTVTRRKLQDFTALPRYCSQATWDSLSGATTHAEKLDAIISLGVRLGLRCPSEHTLKLMCSFWVVVSNSEERGCG